MWTDAALFLERTAASFRPILFHLLTTVHSKFQKGTISLEWSVQCFEISGLKETSSDLWGETWVFQKHRANIHPGTAASLQWACCSARIFPPKKPFKGIKVSSVFLFCLSALNLKESFTQRSPALQRWHCCITLQPEGGTLVNHYSNLIFYSMETYFIIQYI